MVKSKNKIEGTGSAEGALQELKVPMRNGPLPASGVFAASGREAADGAAPHWCPETARPPWPTKF